LSILEIVPNEEAKRLPNPNRFLSHPFTNQLWHLHVFRSICWDVAATSLSMAQLAYFETVCVIVLHSLFVVN
jgi:hypothetical protein